MRPSRTNSFRLHRISRASSVKKQSQTFYQADQTFKLSAINSVTKGVKNADLTFLTGHDLNKLRKEPLDNEDGHYDSAHASLAQIRKKYDQMKKQRTQKDQNIYRLKEQIKKYQIFQNEYQGKIDKGNTDVNKFLMQLDDKKNLLQETAVQKKVLQNMQQRLKWDKVVYDQRKFDLEKEQSFLTKQKSIFKKDGHEIGESTDRTTKVYKKLEKQLEAQRVEREEHIKNLLGMIEKKQSVNYANQSRQREIMEIAERAMQDKDANEKQWYRIYLTHSLLNKMLRNKIDRQMSKFGIVQIAFKTIKTATGVNDAQNLVYKYLNKEAVYGDLLGRITANEQRIGELKEETDRLMRQEKQLEIQKETIQNIKLKTTDISGDIKQLNIIQQRKKIVQTYESKVTHWLVKQVRKFNLIQKTEQTINHPKNKQQNRELFDKFLTLVSQSLKKCDKIEESEANTEAGDLTNRDSARVTRVIPRKSRKNSIGEQIFDIGEEERPQGFDVQENELLNNQRQQLIRNNERFMKQARKRYQQSRKLLIEKDASKKEKKAPEVKRQQDQ